MRTLISLFSVCLVFFVMACCTVQASRGIAVAAVAADARPQTLAECSKQVLINNRKEDSYYYVVWQMRHH